MKEINLIEEGWIFHNHAWHLLHEIIKQIPKDTETMLDFGAGPGMAAAIIKTVYPDIKITVTDIQRECQYFWIKRDLAFTFTPLTEMIPSKYDIILCSHVLEHLENPENELKEFFRVAKKRIIIAVPDGDVNISEHKTIFDRIVLSNTIEKTLEDENYTYVSFPVYHPHINNLMAIIDK